MMIETRGLTKLYAGKIGCSDISLSVKPGHIFGLLGPNGAGKSIFVKMIVGLLHPTSGEGFIMGRPIGDAESRRQIGYLPELFRYHDWLSADEILLFHARLHGFSRAQIRSAAMTNRFKEVLFEVGLEGKGGERVRHFSKGMQQRLGIACAMLAEPALIMLDEPASALDPIGRYEIRTLLQKLRRGGTTVFLNTHLLEDVEALCDEVAFLYQGELKASGPLEAIMQPATRWELVVGGWLPDSLSRIRAESLPGVNLRLLHEAADGSAVLQADVAGREQIGWINRQLIEEGMTLYEVRPMQASLEDWFLSMAHNRRGEPPC